MAFFTKAAAATAQHAYCPAYSNQSHQRGEKSLSFFPSWKTLALASLTSTATRDTNLNPYFLPPPKLLLDNTSSREALNDADGASTNLAEDDEEPNNTKNNINNDTLAHHLSVNSLAAAAAETAIVIDTIENEVARAHDLIDLELSGHGFKRSPVADSAGAAAAASVSQKAPLKGFYANMPPGIRSAIVASAAIVLTSLATFMVIFVVCRWKQHRRRKTNYIKTYNAMKNKLPTLVSNSRRSSLRHHMEEMVIGSSSGGAGVGGSVINTINTNGCGNSSLPGIATVSCVSAPATHQLQRQTSLLFPALRHHRLSAIHSDCSMNSAALQAQDKLNCGTTNTLGSACNSTRGIGSTTSLALSLRSAHNISTTKLNTMDPNSAEVQEYLFDTLRNSFEN